MPKYRKKPVTIEAMQLPSQMGDFTLAPSWFTDAFAPLNDDEGTASMKPGQVAWVGNDLAVCTLEGVVWARQGDYIIRGIKGELYPCKPDIFAATYEAA
jgi:hypothetical protein